MSSSNAASALAALFAARSPRQTNRRTTTSRASATATVHDSAVPTVSLLPRQIPWRRSASTTSEADAIAATPSGPRRLVVWRRRSIERRERHPNEDLGGLLGRLAGRRVRRADVEL